MNNMRTLPVRSGIKQDENGKFYHSITQEGKPEVIEYVDSPHKQVMRNRVISHNDPSGLYYDGGFMEKSILNRTCIDCYNPDGTVAYTLYPTNFL